MNDLLNPSISPLPVQLTGTGQGNNNSFPLVNINQNESNQTNYRGFCSGVLELSASSGQIPEGILNLLFFNSQNNLQRHKVIGSGSGWRSTANNFIIIVSFEFIHPVIPVTWEFNNWSPYTTSAYLYLTGHLEV